jgi:phenylacetate-CoA ligase
MIRYEIGDTGILDEKSSLKTPILKQLTGRTNDLAKLPSGKTVPGLTFYYVTKSIIQNDGNVKEFVIEQVSLDRLSIKYTSEKELTPADQAKIKKAVFQYLEDDLKIDFERFEVLKRSASGKLKQFVSLVDL